MELVYITCSGANEFTSIETLFSLYEEFPLIEFGIQVSGEKCYAGSERFVWLQNLHKLILLRGIDLPLALHLNRDWVSAFCKGDLPIDLRMLLSYQDSHKRPMFKRIQLNFKIGRDEAPEQKMLEQSMLMFPEVRFILSYNQSNAGLIQDMYQNQKVKFDCLFDDSFGEGVLPARRHAPVFAHVVQGYAGGLSPDNICSELDKIALVMPKDAQFFIDAEGKLKGDDGHFSYFKAHDFLANAMHWLSQKK